MRTEQSSFLDFLGQPGTQFTIPVYQRAYSWTTKQCEELFGDIMRSGKDATSHFMSMTLYLDAGESDDGTHRLDIIDGQQRIATMVVMLSAFAEALLEQDVAVGKRASARPGTCAVDGPAQGAMGATELRDRFLTVEAGGSVQAKIRLLGRDRLSLESIATTAPAPEKGSRRVVENYEYFRSRMDASDFDAEVFWAGVKELVVIAAEIDEGDKAQKIFEGLNTKGLPLTAADLIRNYLLVAETRDEQERLYNEYWAPMEIMFEDDQSSSGSLKMNTGFRMWLSIRFRGNRIGDRARTYYYFKQYMEEVYTGTTEELLDELRSFCLLWAQNYQCIEGRTHCSQFDWAKGKSKTLVPEFHRGLI